MSFGSSCWSLALTFNDNRMNTYIVLYRDADILAADPPLAFRCQADDSDHAEEQCLDANPDAEIVWMVMTDDPEKAYTDYWNTDY